MTLIPLLCCAVAQLAFPCLPQPYHGYTKKLSSRVVQTKYGKLRGIVISFDDTNMNSVEAYLGVPYASPPVGNLRFMPPMTPAIWTEIRNMDTFKPVCPQVLRDLSNRTAALESMPRRRYEYLQLLFSSLKNHSEDCLHLNIFVPYRGILESPDSPFPVLVYIHGESYEWGSGNAYDGSVLASFGRVLVITINFRLGILGFLRTGAKNSQMGNFGLLDQIAALHWIRENIEYFDGDRQRVTILGHGHGASLVNLLLASPVTKELISRGIMLSGSALSSWSLVKNALEVKEFVARQFNCSSRDVDIAPCLRQVPLNELLKTSFPTPHFRSSLGPYPDGSVIAADIELRMQRHGGVFQSGELLLCVTKSESFPLFPESYVTSGLDAARRDVILRTFVKNRFQYHRNEIFAAILNEYTDWDRPADQPSDIRNALLRAISDGDTVAGMTTVARHHAGRNGRTYFCVFEHETVREHQEILGTLHGDDLPFILGMPLVDGGLLFPKNYSRVDVSVSELLMTFVSNFVKSGSPNEPIPQKNLHILKDRSKYKNLEWPEYTVEEQKYLSLSAKPKVKSHYRAHEMALWINLIPALHKSGNDGSTAAKHHAFGEDSYDGIVRREPYRSEPFVSSTEGGTTEISPRSDSQEPLSPEAMTSPTLGERGGVQEESRIVPRTSPQVFNDSELWWLPRVFHRNYAVALGVIIAVGCSLLVLNILIFAGVYYHRDHSKGGEAAASRAGATAAKDDDEDDEDDCGGSLSSRKSYGRLFPKDASGGKSPGVQQRILLNHHHHHQHHHHQSRPSPILPRVGIKTNHLTEEDFDLLPEASALYADFVPEPPPPPKSANPCGGVPGGGEDTLTRCAVCVPAAGKGGGSGDPCGSSSKRSTEPAARSPGRPKSEVQEIRV